MPDKIFNNAFMTTPTPGSPLGAGDKAIRDLKEAVAGVFRGLAEGFEAGDLKPAEQNRMLMGTARATVGTTNDKPSDTGLTARDVGRMFYPSTRGSGAGHMNRPWVVVKFGEDIFWAPIPDGYVNDIKFVQNHAEANVSTVKNALTSSENPGWFVADGRTITLPAALGGARTLPDLIDGNPYLRLGEASALPTGAHAKKIAAGNLPEHTHSIPEQTATTSNGGAHTHTAEGSGSGWGAGIGFSSDGATTVTTSEDGEHNHTVTLPATNTGNNSTAHTDFNVEPRRVQLIPIIRIY